MKTLKLIILFQLLSMGHLNAQNWNVFNIAYRYNYKYNNSQLVSQVLFADSAKGSGADSVYYLNRIGIANSYYWATNMPQFLQRNIKKYGNGLVMLYDTAKLVIKPSCQPGQTWLFDSINNVNALCLTKNGHITFGVSDTVKTILVGSNDTLKLSRNFGILQFPELYNKNKYYKLVGVEHAASYDSIPFYGERVPNAWDIYNFNAGDRFCFSDYEFSHDLVATFGYTENFSVKKKNIIADGYSYEVEGARDAWTNNTSTMVPNYSSMTYTLQNYNHLSSPQLRVNKMYPGQLITINTYRVYWNIVSFGVDNNGLFYKFTGSACIPTSTIVFPFSNSNTTTNNYIYANFSELYGVGLGELTYAWADGASGTPMVYNSRSLCTTCAVKAGQLYFGTQTYVGIPEQKADGSGLNVYPNPVRDELSIDAGTQSVSEIRIINLLGETVLQQTDLPAGQKLQVPLRDWANGIYFVQLFNSKGLAASRKIVKN